MTTITRVQLGDRYAQVVIDDDHPTDCKCHYCVRAKKLGLPGRLPTARDRMLAHANSPEAIEQSWRQLDELVGDNLGRLLRYRFRRLWKSDQAVAEELAYVIVLIMAEELTEAKDRDTAIAVLRDAAAALRG